MRVSTMSMNRHTTTYRTRNEPTRYALYRHTTTHHARVLLADMTTVTTQKKMDESVNRFAMEVRLKHALALGAQTYSFGESKELRLLGHYIRAVGHCAA